MVMAGPFEKDCCANFFRVICRQMYALAASLHLLLQLFGMKIILFSPGSTCNFILLVFINSAGNKNIFLVVQQIFYNQITYKPVLKPARKIEKSKKNIPKTTVFSTPSLLILLFFAFLSLMCSSCTFFDMNWNKPALLDFVEKNS